MGSDVVLLGCLLGHRLESVETTSIITSVPLRCDVLFELADRRWSLPIDRKRSLAAFAELPLATT